MTTRDARSLNDDDDADFEFIDFEPTTPADTTTADTSLTARHPHDPDSFLPAALDDIVLSSLHDLHFVLSPSTTILRVSANCLSLLGCEPSLLVGQRLAALVHADDAAVFSSEITSALHLTGYQHAAVASGFLARATQPPFRFYCRIRSVVHVDADYSAFELVGHYQVKVPDSLAPLQLMMPPPGVISITARPAFTARGYHMDGMLELKMEQVRLVRRIAQIKREAVEEDWGYDDDGADEDEGGQQQQQQQQQPTAAATTAAGYAGAFRHVDQRAFGRAARRGNSSRSRSSPPRFVLGETSPAGRGQHPAPGHIKEEDQEGAPGPSKVKVGELGIPFVVRPDGFEKKLSEGHRLPKRKFMVREFCCSRCGTLESPEWRAGPDGPKTLCNACGLKYAKEQRRVARMKPVASE